METEASGGELVVDVDTGVYGHRVTMLDFLPEDLARFREMAKIVGFEDRPPQVLTALSISGSAAQSKINAYPADCDFFERVHIRADTREEACAILADLMREKALATMVGPTHRLWEVKFGSHPVAATKGGSPVGAGSPMSWTAEEVKAGQMEVTLADGALRVYTWEDASHEPGWCKLDWVIADKTRGQLANASNVLDPTWEAPDGTIVPLDGFLDPYFQEVYLESESIPLFSKLVKELSADSVDDYVETLEHEVWKYTVKEPNYGKAARRMYNVFRMNGHYREAAYIRELFDEPVTALYQVAALIRTLDDAASSGDDVRGRDDGRPDRRPDHVGDPGARRAGGGRDGRPPAAPPELAPGARGPGRAGRRDERASRTPRSRPSTPTSSGRSAPSRRSRPTSRTSPSARRRSRAGTAVPYRTAPNDSGPQRTAALRPRAPVVAPGPRPKYGWLPRRHASTLARRGNPATGVCRPSNHLPGGEGEDIDAHAIALDLAGRRRGAAAGPVGDRVRGRRHARRRHRPAGRSG